VPFDPKKPPILVLAATSLGILTENSENLNMETPSPKTGLLTDLWLNDEYTSTSGLIKSFFFWEPRLIHVPTSVEFS
jgi:hypothetical protein